MFSKELADGLEDFYKSLKRNDATQRQNGERKATEGKEAMPFGLYKWLAKYFLSKSQLFEWIYLIYCWNLMCRTNNVAGVKLSHLHWVDDSLTIVIPKTKTDQGVS